MSEGSLGALTAARAKDGILAVGGLFGATPKFQHVFERLGSDRWPFYFAGRSGVMGDVEAETVAAAFGFFSPSFVARCIEESAASRPPCQVAREDRAALPVGTSGLQRSPRRRPGRIVD